MLATHTEYVPVAGVIAEPAEAEAERSAAVRAIFHQPELDPKILQQVLDGLRRL